MRPVPCSSVSTCRSSFWSPSSRPGCHSPGCRLGLAACGPPWLTAGERVVIGLVLAVVALTMAGYVAALAIGVTVGLVLLLALAGIAAGGWLLWHHRGRYGLPAFPRRSGAPNS